jgi:predicted transposase/invertase (TIGR01784 family)
MGSIELRDVLEETGLTEEWIAKGMEKGIEYGKIQVAVNMIKDGFSLEDVSKYSGLPVEELKELPIS